MANCEDCIHAAFDQGGVFCKLFGESILLPEVVAAECGEFDPGSDAPVREVFRNGVWEVCG